MTYTGAVLSATPTVAGYDYAPALNPRAFGGVGNGIRDDWRALQGAINAAADSYSNGGWALLPPGKWAHSAPLVIPGNLFFGSPFGFGGGVLIPEFDGDAIQVGVGSATQLNQVHLQGFAIYPTANRATGAGLHLGYVGKCTVRDVKIGNALGGNPFYAVQLDRASDTKFQNVLAEGAVSDVYHLETQSGQTIVEIKWDSACTIRNGGGYGVNVVANNTVAGGGGDIEGLHFDATDISTNALAGIMLNAVGDQPPAIKTIHLKGTGLDTNGGGGLVTAGTGAIWMVELVGLWVSANSGGDGVYLGSQVRDALVLSSTIRGSGGHGLTLDGLQRALLGGLLVYDNSQAADLASYGLNLNAGTLRLLGQSAVYNTGGSAKRQNGVRVAAAPTNDILDNIRCSTGVGTTPISWAAPSGNRMRATNLWDNDGSNTAANVKNLGSGTDAATIDGFGNASFSAQVQAHGYVPNTVTISGNTTLSNTNEYVRVNASSLAVTLPPANTLKAGQDIQLKNVGVAASTSLVPAGADTIDGTGGTNATLLSAAKAKVTLRSDGVSTWDVAG